MWFRAADVVSRHDLVWNVQMPALEPYRETTAPPESRCLRLVLKPIGWKARMWRAFDNSVTIMMRLDTPLELHDLDADGRALFEPFRPSLRGLKIYLERGASVPIPNLPWSIGRITFQREHSSGFLHRVLDDPFGMTMTTMFRTAETLADLTLLLALYESQPDALTFAVRDYDIGVGAEFLHAMR
jgi:hypothetical protein